MNWNIKPSQSLSGDVTVPADKSITHRAIMLAALADGTSVISNYLPAQDCMATLEAFVSMGVTVRRTHRTITIVGAGAGGLRQPGAVINAGNSGTTVRLLSGIIAGQDINVTITGDESLSRRPMRRIMDPLRRMGVSITARDDNYLPLEIKGNSRLAPVQYDLPIASAQVKSCILLAGMQAGGTTSVTEPVRSRDHTERMLRARGVDVNVEGCRVSVNGPARLSAIDMTVPADISSAAFFLVAGLIVPSSCLMLKGVGINPTRDGIVEVLRAMNGKISAGEVFDVSGEPAADIEVRGSVLAPFTIGESIIPRLVDEIPVLVLAATQAEGVSVISGAGELRVKESDRLAVITNELSRMGAKIEEKPDGLVIYGPTPLTGARCSSCGDHRIAMTLAVAGLIAGGETTIEDVDCVETSFPGFMEKLASIQK